MTKITPSHRADFAIACLLSVFWAPSFFILKDLQGVFSYTGLGLVRFAIVNLSFWILLRIAWFRTTLHVKMPPTLLDRIAAVCLGLFFNGPAYMTYFFGMHKTVGAEATILVTSSPILLALGASVFLHERMPRIQWVGLGVGLVGVYAVTMGGWVPMDFAHMRSPGNLYVLAGVMLETAATILAVPLVKRSSGIGIISHAMFGNLIFFIGASLVTQNPVFTGVMSASQIGAFCYLALVCGLALFGLWYWVMERVPLGIMGVTLYVQAPSAALYGWLFYNQLLPAGAIQGGALILIGLWLSSRKQSNLIKPGTVVPEG